jgi:hypothetical protein
MHPHGLVLIVAVVLTFGASAEPAASDETRQRKSLFAVSPDLQLRDAAQQVEGRRAELPRHRSDRPNLLRPDAFAPTRKLEVQAADHSAEPPKIACGMPLIPADPSIDPRFIVPQEGHQLHFTLRSIPPPICR